MFKFQPFKADVGGINRAAEHHRTQEEKDHCLGGGSVSMECPP